MHNFSWQSAVRSYEVDVQGIVNNACYLNYFDHARVLHLKELGLDWVKLSKNGLNFVLFKTNIRFHKSLHAFEPFRVDSMLTIEGKLKVLFEQSIYNHDNQLICTGNNTVVCVDSSRNKPVSISSIIPTLG